MLLSSRHHYRARNRVVNHLLTLLSAILITLVGPNFFQTSGLPFLAPFALVPLFILYYRLSNIKSMLAYSALFGALFSLFSNYWLYFFQDMRLLTLLGAALGVSLTTAVGTLPIYFFVKQNNCWRPFLIAMGWALFEYSRTIGFFAFPWALIAYSFHDYPLFNQIIDITGLTALSFLIALYNAIISDFFIQNFTIKNIRVALIFTLLITLIIVTYGAYRFNQVEEKEKEIIVLLTQQNDDAWSGSLFKNHIQAVNTLLDRELEPDLIVSGESVLNTEYHASSTGVEPNTLPDYIAETATPHLIGGPVRGSWGFYNGTVLTNAQGEVTSSYGKHHLVPMAEGIPWMEHPLIHNFFYKHRLYTGWERGKELTIFKLAVGNHQFVNFSSPICYEDAFPTLNRKAVLKGSEIFINQTNDSWSQTDAALAQHLVAAKFRSIENRTPLVRAANSGLTVVINTKGQVVHSLKGFTQGALLVKVPISHRPFTFYSRYGHWPIALFIIIIGLYYLVQYRRAQFY